MTETRRRFDLSLPLKILEIVIRCTFYLIIVVLSVLLITALQVRQQIKSFDDFLEFAYYANKKDGYLTPSLRVAELDSQKYHKDEWNWIAYKTGLNEELNALKNALVKKGVDFDPSKFAIQDYTIQVAEATKSDIEIQKLLDTRQTDLQNLLIATTQLDQLKPLIQSVDARKNELGSENSQNDEHIAEILKRDAAGQVTQTIIPEKRLYGSLYKYLYIPIIGPLVGAPADFVVMILAMLMGAVGGILSIAKSIVDDQTPPPKRNDYFLRPTFGILTALVVFVLFKAGQLAFSSSFSETAGLNPFVVGFIGVISGAMARPAIGRIERAGAALFGSDLNVVYYARSLKSEWDKLSNEDRDQFIARFGITAAILEKWLTEKEPISESDARVIAAYLRLPIRQIFSREPG